MIAIAHTAGKMLSVLELEILYMLWTMLRWNLGNTSAIAAFCLLPIITFGDANFNDRQPTEVTPFAKLQNGNIELTAFAQNACATTHHQGHRLMLTTDASMQTSLFE